MRLAAAIPAALLLAGCGMGFSIRAGVNLPDGTEPYVEVRIDPRVAQARAERNAED